jgi:hypothetical protein
MHPVEPGVLLVITPYFMWFFCFFVFFYKTISVQPKYCSPFDNIVILKFNMSFGRELVVSLTKPSMFGRFVVHAWR